MKPVFEIANFTAPSQGPRAMPVSFNFALQPAFTGDLFMEMENGLLDIIQTVYVDNSLNALPFFLFIPGVGDGLTIKVPPRYQGYYAVVVPLGKVQYVASTQGAVVVPCVFFNVPFPYYAGTTIAPADPTPTVITGAYTNRGLAMTGASLQVMAANASRKGFTLQSPSSNNNPIRINYTAPAAFNSSSLEILPGGSIVSINVLTTEAIFAIGTNTEVLVAKELL